jgi:hypothetical protein
MTGTGHATGRPQRGHSALPRASARGGGPLSPNGATAHPAYSPLSPRRGSRACGSRLPPAHACGKALAPLRGAPRRPQRSRALPQDGPNGAIAPCHGRQPVGGGPPPNGATEQHPPDFRYRPVGAHGLAATLHHQLTLVPRASRPQGIFSLFAENGSADVLRARRPRYQAVRPWRTVKYLANYMRINHAASRHHPA